MELGNPPLFLKNVQTQTKKFLKSFGTRSPPPLFGKIPRHKQKSSSKSLVLGNPTPLSEKCPNMNRTKKFLKMFGFRHDPPPPLWKNSKRKQIFFRWLPLVAKQPIFFIASLFCYILLLITISVCVKAKVKIMLSQYKKKVVEKN